MQDPLLQLSDKSDARLRISHPVVQSLRWPCVGIPRSFEMAVPVNGAFEPSLGPSATVLVLARRSSAPADCIGAQIVHVVTTSRLALSLKRPGGCPVY